MSNDDIKVTAKFIAMMVRNGIEDFHCKHLTDEQMRELNPLIRNAIYTSLYVMEHGKVDRRFDELTNCIFQSIPSYWEDPELWSGIANSQKNGEEPTL